MSDDAAAGEPLPDVWFSRDFPVLREVTRLVDIGGSPVIDEIAELTGMPLPQVELASRSLARRGLVRGISAGGGVVIRFTDVSPAAYTATGLHPDGRDLVADLVAALRQAAEELDDEQVDERTRLQRAADGLASVSRNVAAGVVTALITSQMPT